MKPHFIRLITLVAVLFLSPVAHGWRAEQIQQLDSNRFKLFWYFPLYSNWDTQASSSWFEVVYCSDPSRTESCNRLIQKIPFNWMRVNGTLSADLGSDLIRLKFSPTGRSETITIATQEVDQHWYPRVELCSSHIDIQQCHYTIGLDVLNRTISVSLTVAK